MLSPCGSVAFIVASALPKICPTPRKVSPIVWPGAVTRSLAVLSGLSAVLPADSTAVSAPFTSSTFAVAPISRKRTRNRSLPLILNGPHLVFTLNTYWKFSTGTLLPIE